jgi:Bacterial alpha-L-rhamnosidase 6 hairpin glycosidase domain/Bacterial alpha-L-rhamnosidase C-terminal domain
LRPATLAGATAAVALVFIIAVTALASSAGAAPDHSWQATTRLFDSGRIGAAINSYEQTLTAGTNAGGPWSDRDYKPKPGDWRPYVLAPKSHEVRPTAVVSAMPRGGSITGNPDAAVTRKGTVTLTSTGDQTTSPLLMLDFGKEVAGRVQVTIKSTSATPPSLHACFSESLAYAALQPGENDGETAYAPGCDTANIWNGYPGFTYSWDSDSHTLTLTGKQFPATVTDPMLRGGFRYLTLFLASKGTVTISGVSLKYTAAPLQKDPANYKGWFESSDNTLNKIWYAGAYTTQIDTGMSDTAKSWPYTTGEADSYDAQIPGANPKQEVIFDGGKRDRDIWQGDLGVEAPVTYLSTDDVGAVNNSLSALASQQLSDGYVPAEGLVGSHNTGEETTYGEYVTWYVNNMAVHYLYTGDRKYLVKYYPGLVKAMAWLESVRELDSGGLISFASTNSCGTYAYSDCDHLTYINALYYRNLRQMATLSDALGDTAAGKAYLTEAAGLKHDINSELWNAKVGAYELSREDPTLFPQDANATAILTGVASATQSRRALAYLQANTWSTYGSLMINPADSGSAIPVQYEPLPEGFEAEARLSGQDADELTYDTGLQLISKYWGWQLTQDPHSTFWEKTTTSGQPAIGSFTSLAHGWASGPTIALTTQVLGLSPVSAGYATWSVIPHPSSLTWAQGAVPTPHGKLKASWTHKNGRFTETVTAPSGTTGQLGIPTFGSKIKVVLDGKLVWNGSSSPTHSAAGNGSYVTVSGVKAGTHRITATAITKIPTKVQLAVSPSSTAGTAGGQEAVTVMLTGIAPKKLDGTLSISTPAGFRIEPDSTKVSRVSDGRTVSATATFYVQMPTAGVVGTRNLKIAFKDSGRVLASATTSVVGPPHQNVLYSFANASTDGWTAGTNVSSVSSVSSFADGPGAPATGSTDALDAACSGAPADQAHDVQVTPTTALDLSNAKTFSFEEDGYGSVPGATSYTGTLELTTSKGAAFTKTVTITPNTWNLVTANISSWAGRGAITGVSVGFSAPGSSYDWGCHFQVDDVGWNK